MRQQLFDQFHNGPSEWQALPRMSSLPAGTVRDRLAVILESCGYNSVAELGDALGESRATVSAWQTRNTYGTDGAPRLHDLTGADINWLMGRGNVPFPDSPKINPALRVARLHGDIRELRKVILELAHALTTTKQVVAREWFRRLESGVSSTHAESLFRGLLLAALETSPEPAAASHNHAPAVQSPAKRGQRKQK